MKILISNMCITDEDDNAAVKGAKDSLNPEFPSSCYVRISTPCAEEIAVKVVNLFDLCSDQYPASPRDHAWLAG